MRTRWLAGLAMLLGIVVGTPASAQNSATGTGITSGGTGSSGLSGGTSGLGGGSSGGGLGSGGSSGGLGGGGGGGLGGGTGGGLGGGTGGGAGGGSTDIGGGSFTSGGLLGQGSLTGATSNNTASIGGTSLLGKNYSYPLGKGLPTQNIIGGNQSGTANVAFGQPLFNVSAAGGTGATGRQGAGAVGGAGGFQGGTGIGTATTTTGQGGFGSSAGVDRIVPYITELGFEPTLTPPTVVGQQVQNMLATSTRLSNQGIQVLSTGDGHVIRGQAATERERRVAEAMARLTPGVRAIRNEVVVIPGR